MLTQGWDVQTILSLSDLTSKKNLRRRAGGVASAPDRRAACVCVVFEDTEGLRHSPHNPELTTRTHHGGRYNILFRLPPSTKRRIDAGRRTEHSSPREADFEGSRGVQSAPALAQMMNMDPGVSRVPSAPRKHAAWPHGPKKPGAQAQSGAAC